MNTEYLATNDGFTVVDGRFKVSFYSLTFTETGELSGMPVSAVRTQYSNSVVVPMMPVMFTVDTMACNCSTT